jgi:DNA helicase HerA-like ATPase
LLWLLSELFEKLPESGDLDKPKLVFFFDEAHLLFSEAPKALVARIEQVVRLIRSKGVGIYFVSQSPLDIADSVLTQLGNRVQHALRAFTTKDQKAIKATAETFRSDGTTNLQQVIGELAIGEAIVSLLDEDGSPCIAQRALIVPPQSRLGAITPAERRAIIESSTIYGVYEEMVDRESAYEILRKRMEEAGSDDMKAQKSADSVAGGSVLSGIFGSGGTRRSGRSSRQGPLEALMISIARAIGSQIGRSVSRGVFGSLTSRGRRR